MKFYFCKVKKILISISIFILLFIQLYAQEKCGHSYLNQKHLSVTHLYNSKTMSGKKIIPVVFHVIHNNGPEKISIAQCESAIEALNRDFRRQYGTRGGSMGVDTEIEFSLATLDPSGFPTTGVTYTQSSLTNHSMDNDANLKQLIIWDTERYLNVWVVKEIGGGSGGGTVLGYAYYPGAPANLDGIVNRADCLGSKEVYPQGFYFGDNIYSRTLTHEVGHYLNLPHTFDGGCASDDGISDTPPANEPNYGSIKRINSCNNDVGTDLPDQVRNYMDYSSDFVADMFTEGQKQEIHAALSLYRSTLISNTNLMMTGTGKYKKPKASFWVSQTIGCPGTGFTLIDYSRGEPSQWNWTVFNTNFSQSFNSQFPNFSLSTPGKYSVQLIVQNLTDSDTLVIDDLIEIEDPSVNTFTVPFFEGFEGNTFPPTGWNVINYDKFNPEDSITFKQFKLKGGFGQSSRSVRMNNYGYSTYGQTDILVSPYINLQGLSNPHLSFNVAYAQLNMQNGFPLILSDTLYVMINSNCGGWYPIWMKGGQDLATDTAWIDPFVGFPNHLWRNETIDLSLFANQTIQIYFLNRFGGGNMLYLDDIQISDLSSLQNTNSNHLSVYPNPFNNYFQIQINDLPASLTVFDVHGKEIQKMDIYEPTFYYKTDNWQNGIYILKIQTKQQTYYHKIIKL